MNRILFFKSMLICMLFSFTLLANDTYSGIVKQDVNVRSLPDYESKIAYVLRKNENVNIEALVKTKNKGSWYKIKKGFVSIRFVATDSIDIPNKTLNELTKLTEKVTPKTTTKIEIKEVEEVKQIVKNKTLKENPVLVKVEEVAKEKVVKKDQIQEPLKVDKSLIIKEDLPFVEPVVITKDENNIMKYINFQYILYGILGFIIPILFIILIKKVFSKPSITDQIDQHKKRSDFLKKALKSNEEKPVDKE